MTEVIKFPGVTRLDTPPETVLEAAQEEGLTACLVVGYDANGDFYFAGSPADGGEALWLLERAKHRLMQITDELEEGDA